VNVGARARVGAISVEGDSSLAAHVVARELPVDTGDLFDASALAEGQREIFGLGLFTLALVDVAPSAVRGDTIVPVRIRVQRGPSRVLSAFTGYFSDGGVTLRSAATHRNAFGGARQLSANIEWRTGIGSGIGGGTQSVTGGPIRDFRVSLPFRQPYVLDRRVSYTLQPSYRVRDDEIESSTQLEVSNTLLFTRAPLQTIGLSLTGRRRDLSRGLGIRLLDAGRFEPAIDPLLPDSLQATTGVVGLDVVWGQVDDPLQPTRGFVIRPSASIAAGDVSYGRGRVAASVTIPIGDSRRTGVVGRVVAGGLMPFGGSDVDAVGDYVLLRDQLFYAGGTSDVRGWASAQLGPKTFSITAPSVVSGEIPDPARVTSRGDISYVGVGGRLKGSASVQLNLPLPIGPQWGANVFVDGGVVESSSAAATNGLIRAGGTRADIALADTLDQEGGIRVGAGAGIQYLTPVGFVSFAIGVKVNPSYLDLRTPALVYCGSSIEADEPVCFGGAEIDAPTAETELGYIDARLSGRDFDPAGIDPGSIFRRLQFHLSIGQTF
ncbi:BamA/TamA family outer membrane protein, partial [Rubrivirga sp.]|uniref:BamA/TamA family outer membrane protein n=1 Tax=Rubrivirga sp. TaxID=1885344 RepID=UPI003C707CF8